MPQGQAVPQGPFGAPTFPQGQPQGYPPQGAPMPQQAAFPQPGQGFAPQGMPGPPQGYPPQGMPQQPAFNPQAYQGGQVLPLQGAPQPGYPMAQVGPAFVPQQAPQVYAVPNPADDDIASAADEANRYPRISPGCITDNEVERVHVVSARDGKNFTEFVFRVIATNSPAMPVGHVWSIFQYNGYDGAKSIFKGCMTAILGHTKETLAAAAAAGTPVDLNGAFKAARSPQNPARGCKVRATAVSKAAGAKSKFPGKVYTDAKLSKYDGSAIPTATAAPVEAAPTQQVSSPAQAFTPAAFPGAAPAVEWVHPESGHVYDLNTQQRIR